MPRLLLVLALGIAIAVCALVENLHFVGLVVGLLAGAGFMLAGMARGGGLPEAGFAFSKGRRGDPNAGIGTALAAAGIACAASANTSFPVSFRVFYGVCIGAGILIAVFLAWRSRVEAKDNE